MADVLWFDARSQRAAVWKMRGTHLVAPGPELPGPAGGGWTLAYSADFDGDGMADLLWHHPARNLFAVWTMLGTCLSEPGPELPAPAGDGWIAPSSADFNLDGMADILWYNTLSHRVSVWLMRGTEILERGPEIPEPAGKSWAAVTTADFNRDGMGRFWCGATPPTAAWPSG